MWKSSRLIQLFAIIFFWSLEAHASVSGYYRWPALHGDTLVFASEGDLWRAPASGGDAVRLTTHNEEETKPAISPDGMWIAFNARYDGANEVYVMPLAGGAPKQLTFEGFGTSVRGWAPDGRVLYTSASEPGRIPRVLRVVNPDDGAIETLPVWGANLGVFSGDGGKIFFTRYGLSLWSDNAILYRGGRMSPLWRYQLGGAKEAVRLAENFAAPIRHPMWWNSRIYFTTDKSGADNIWSVDENGGDARQHTNFVDWQLKNPQLWNGDIVYQRGADIYRYNISGNLETKIDLTLISDRDFTRTRWLEKPLTYLEAARVGAKGKSVAVTARGNVAVAFPGKRRRVELDIPLNARARSAIVGADGKWIYAIVDQERTGEIWRFAKDGGGKAEQLTENSDAHLWSLHPSPDGERILFDDKRGRLWSLDVNSKRKTLLETNDSGDDAPFAGFTWSPKSRFVAYRIFDKRYVARVVLRDLESGRRQIVTGGKYNSFDPAFAADGSWLYFLSDRNFKATPSHPWGDRTMGPSFDKRTKIYAIQLNPKADFPFKRADELSGAGDSDDADEDDDEDGGKVKAAKITFNGVADRLWSVPVKPGNYNNLKVNKKFLYVLDSVGEASALKSIKIDPKKAEVKKFASKVKNFDLSADGKTLFFNAGDGAAATLALVPAGAKAPDEMAEHKLRVGDWRLAIQPDEEWRQMLRDAWRMHRDFAYDQQLRGLDWNMVLDKYEPFVARIGNRNELNDLLGLMTAELGILHSQIRTGDLPKDMESGAEAFLGAKFRQAPGGLEITEIYRGEADLPDTLGPLLKSGVDVRVGDLLTNVDGRAVSSHAQLSYALQHKAGQQVRLDLRRGRSGKSAIVKPINAGAAQRQLYAHWVEENRQRVAAASEGDIGYLHLRAMGGGDIASFARDFYEHFDKDAIIIDVRGNGGGNVDSMIIATLLRRVWAFWEGPIAGPPGVNMQQTFRGHLAVLIDEGTYSDGETFAAGIKALDLAPLIGVRTAGAGIWLSGRNPLSDKGMARIAEFPQFGLDGRWLIEGHGVSPDIEVVNPPHATFNGADAQLDAALTYLKDKVASEPIPELKGQPLPPVGTTGRDVD